jgi:serine phosphatase RsbU (regulator of sigma subunit)
MMEMRSYKRSLLLLLVAGVIGYALLFPLFAKLSAATRWGFELDRAEAVAKAKAHAAAFGVDITGGRAVVNTRYNREHEFYLSRETNPLGGGLLSALTVIVTLSDVSARRVVKVEMNQRGQLLELDIKEPTSALPAGNVARQTPTPTASPVAATSIQQTPQTDSPDQANQPNSLDQINQQERELAETTLNRLLDQQSQASGQATFGALSDSRQNGKDRRYVRTAADQKLKLRAEAVLREGRLREVFLASDLTPQFQAEYDAKFGERITLLTSADNFVLWPTVILLALFFLIGLGRKRIQHRNGLIFLAVAFLFLLVVNTLGSFADDFFEGFRITGSAPSSWWEIVVSWLIFGLINLMTAGALYLIWATGLSLAIQLPDRKTFSLELLLKGKLLTKPVAVGLAAGLLAGGLFCVAPYVIAATGLFANIKVSVREAEDAFTARLPEISAFTNGTQIILFLVFAFVAPLICAFVRRAALAWSGVFIVALFTLMGAEFVGGSSAGLTVTSLVLALIVTTVYFSFDLLAVVMMSFSAQAAVTAAAMLWQPAASLRYSGWYTLLSLAGLIVVGLVGVGKFRDVKEEEQAVPRNLLAERDERGRLRAEFEVARRAQQQMLPDAPPDVPGLEIAAVCHPSKEVGGDLYDFLKLPDGRLGIVVADVSGKGVPASLYMTLTKGLLNSVSEEQTDPGQILREVNRHLYEVCRRKVFVTLFLGVIDPQQKTLAYARAGHNPTVFWRAGERKATLLKSSGMGLGLNGGKIFDQTLKVATLPLEPDDKLFFYSDGITEAMNNKNEEYGEERLMMIAAQASSLRAPEARDAIMSDVGKFLGTVAPQDDQTLVVVRVI